MKISLIPIRLSLSPSSAACPAGVCKALITYSIDNENCNGCGACLKACATNAITGLRKKGETFEIKEVECNRCGACAAVCKFDAVKVA